MVHRDRLSSLPMQRPSLHDGAYDLGNFDFEVSHRADVKRQAADVLSRLQTNRQDDNDFNYEIPVWPIQRQSRNDNHQLSCSCRDYDGPTVNCEPQPILSAEVNVAELPTIAEFVPAQCKDAFCDQIKRLVGTPNCLFKFDKYGLLVRQAPPDESLQTLVPISLHPTILYLLHLSTVAGHPVECHIYDALRCDYY